MSKKFNPNKITLSHSPSGSVEVKKMLTNIPVGKPSKTDFIRVNPDEAYQAECFIIEHERETYWVHPSLCDELKKEIKPVLLVLSVNRKGIYKIWPLKLPTSDYWNPWSKTAFEAAQMAQNSWIRVTANHSTKVYDVIEASGEIPEPSWPDKTFDDLLEIAFKGMKVESSDHLIVRQLSGEI